MSGLAYIRKTYSVPAYRGQLVRFSPDTRDKPMLGRIVGARGPHLRVRFEGHKVTWICHPTWAMEYLSDQLSEKQP